MAKMNPGVGAGAPMAAGQPQKKAPRSPGEQMRMPAYVPPAMNSAAQPLQMTAAPAMATMPAKRNMLGGPEGTR